MANAKSPSRWLGPVFVLCAVIALTASCGGDDLDAQTVGSSTPPGGGACGTPQEGCPCTSPGTAVACGKQVVQGPSSFLYCYEGTRVCGADGKYGPCADGALTVRSTNALSIGTGGLETRSYGTSQACNSYGAGGSDAGASDSGTVDAGSGEIDPCDPYCTVRSDTPAGLSFDAGFGLVEGGLAVVSLTDGGVVPSSPQSTANGDSLCGGAANVHATTCSTPADCQQDFSCVAGQCKWNGGPGYFDGTVATPDLTVGAACDFSGSPVVPVCNRGSAPVAAGTILGVNIVNAVENGCTANYPSRDCAVTVGTGGLPPGACVNIGGCPISGDKIALVNAGKRDVPSETQCSNNAGKAKTTGTPGCATCQVCETKLTGTIMDPRGVVPLPNVVVYVPSTTPGALPVGPSCDTCSSLATGNPMVVASTKFDGSFVLSGVPANRDFQLVILAGKWRRIVTVPAITACGSATLAPASAHLPRNHAEGNIPKMGLTLAAGDHLECLLRKIGIDDAEFTAGGGGGRVELYQENGLGYAGASGYHSLWGNAGTLNNYDFIVAPCHNGPGLTVDNDNGPNDHSISALESTPAERANMKAYLNAGGRLFATHLMSSEFVSQVWPAPAGPETDEWGTNVHDDREPGSMIYSVDTTSSVGQTLSKWAPLVGAGTAGPPTTIKFDSWRHQIKSVNTASGAVLISSGDSRNAPTSHARNSTVWGGPHVNMYEFDTPWPSGSCGRVVVSQSHVSGGSGNFPAGCGSASTATTPQEKAFEFLMFQATACIGPPPPSPAVPVNPLPLSQTYSVDFAGACADGEKPIWQLFEWKATTPPGTSIEFRASTSNDETTFSATPPALPGSVPVGVANDAAAVTTASGWTYDSDGTPAQKPRPVSAHLANDPPSALTSEQFLRVYMTFHTDGATSPRLTEWRQLYDCVPNE